MSLPSVGVCAIFKNEAPYLREWMLFCWLQGVERFWLYDNDSSDAWREQIPELADSVTPWPGRAAQVAAYANCLAHQADTDWLAFIDVDEYLFDESGRTLTDVLADVKASAVRVPWRVFGDGGHEVKPRGLTVDSFLRCQDGTAQLGKMIVRPGKVRMVANPHECVVRGKVTELDGLRCHHYWTRSEAEARIKWGRRRAAVDERRSWHEFTTTRDAYYETVDPLASLLYGPILRAELA